MDGLDRLGSRTLPELAEIQEPAGSCGRAGGGKGLVEMTEITFEILQDGAPRSYRDSKSTAMGAAQLLKLRQPNSEVVVVKDLRTGEITPVAVKPGLNC